MFVNIIPIKTVLGKPFLNKNSESVKNADNFVNFVLSAHNKTPYGIVKRFQLVLCAILRYAQNDRFERNPVGACVKMLNLYKPRRGGLPRPPEQFFTSVCSWAFHKSVGADALIRPSKAEFCKNQRGMYQP